MAYSKEEVKQTFWDVADSVRGTMKPTDVYKLTMSIAFIKYSCSKTNREFNAFDFESLKESANEVEDEFLRMFILETLHNMNFLLGSEKLGYIASLVPEDEELLAQLISDVSVFDCLGREVMECVTPESVNKIALDVLNIQSSDMVANLNSGAGSFLNTYASNGYTNEVCAYEKNYFLIAISKMAAFVLGTNVQFRNADTCFCTDEFDKCFMVNPWGLPAKNVSSLKKEELCIDGVDYKEFPRIWSADWLFCLNALSHLKPMGKVVGVIVQGSLFSIRDSSIRQMFVENGWVESVVSLPAKIYPYTGVSTALVVLSFNNEKVRLVDASNFYDKGRRLNTINNDQCLKIVDLLNESREGLSTTVDVDEIAAKGYVLDPSRYLLSPIEVKNPVELGSLVSVTRGSTWGKAKLEKYNSIFPTLYNYLELRNMNNGEIDNDLPYLTKIESSQQRYCAEEGDVILSKTGPNFKVAVVGDLEGRQLLVSGNLYILRVDKSKANPLYIKAFLETESGMAQLDAVVVGATIPNIPVSALDRVKIPGLPLEEQNELVRQYEKLRRDNNRYAERIQLNKEKMLHLFDEI